MRQPLTERLYMFCRSRSAQPIDQFLCGVRLEIVDVRTNCPASTGRIHQHSRQSQAPLKPASAQGQNLYLRHRAEPRRSCQHAALNLQKVAFHTISVVTPAEQRCDDERQQDWRCE
jgi:hypothetical protein